MFSLKRRALNKWRSMQELGKDIMFGQRKKETRKKFLVSC